MCERIDEPELVALLSEQLRDGRSASPIDKTERYVRSMGLVRSAAAKLDIELNLYGRTGWTRDSHKLIALAGLVDERRREMDRVLGRGWSIRSSGGSGSEGSSSPGRDMRDSSLASLSSHDMVGSDRCVVDHITNPLQHTLVEALFAAHFSGGADLSSRPFLLSIANSFDLLGVFKPGFVEWNDRRVSQRYSMKEQLFLDWLDGTDSARLVDELELKSRRDGVEGVPTFEIQGRYRIGGAQVENVFLDIFERVRLQN